MTDNIPQAPQGEFVLFTSTDGQTRVECRFESDTLWLSQAAMAELYQVSTKAETAMYRYKQLISPKLSLRNHNAQVGEMLAGVKVLNKVIGLGMPVRQPLN